MLRKFNRHSMREFWSRRTSSHRAGARRRSAARTGEKAWQSMEPLEPRMLLTVFTGELPFTVFTNQLDNEAQNVIDAQFGPGLATYKGRLDNNNVFVPYTPGDEDINVFTTNFTYDDVTKVLTIDTPTPIVELPGADGIELDTDNNHVIVGGGLDDGSIHRVDLSNSNVQTQDLGDIAFHVTIADGKVYTSDQPGTQIGEVSLDFSTILGTVNVGGDDSSITQLVFVPDGQNTRVFYSRSNRDGGDASDGDGQFGEIDLATGTTRRIFNTLEASHAAIYDPFTDSIFIAGGKRITQLKIQQQGGDPAIVSEFNLSDYLTPLSRELVVVAQVPIFGNQNVPTGDELAVLDHIDVTGQGQIFFTANSGHLGLIDYRDTGLVGDGTLATDGSGFLALDLDDIAIRNVMMEGGGALPEVNITATDADASEEGPDTGTFRVARTGSTTSSLDVLLDLGASTATNETDFHGLANILVTIPAGESFLDIVITPVDDSEPEANEFVVASFTAQSGYTIGANDTATITITDNDQGGGGDMDFGDAPESYGIASHGLGSGPTLGSAADAEASSQFSANADGDDTNGTDDEDGVFFLSPLDPGAQNLDKIQVFASQSGFYDAWIDFNGDGDFTDEGEQIAQSRQIFAGGNDFPFFDVPADAVLGATYARFRISSEGGLGPTGAAADGEVEDYVVIIGRYDFGDAPDSYGTTLNNDGARHTLIINSSFNSSTFFLGSTPDSEVDGQPTASADGDDVDDFSNTDDEDGVTFADVLRPGQNVGVSINYTSLNFSGAEGLLNAWIDFDRSGTFENDEQIFTNQTLESGVTNELTINVPADAAPGLSYARFRVSSQADLGPTGLAPDGEVEDYVVGITASSAGTLDPSFSQDGIDQPTLPQDINKEAASDVVALPDGSFLVAAISGADASHESIVVLKYKADGTLDTSFGTGGRAAPDLGFGFANIPRIAVRDDGKIAVAASVIDNQTFVTSSRIVLLNASGSTDNSFNVIDLGADESVTTLAAGPSNRLFVLTNISGAGAATIRSFNANGTVNNSFDNGHTEIENGFGGDLAVQSDGKVVAVGAATPPGPSTFSVIARFNTNGLPDNSFGTAGVVLTDLADGDFSDWNHVALAPGGKIVVSSHVFTQTGTKNVVARFNANGTLDNTFGSGGMVELATEITDVFDLAVEDDGQVLVLAHVPNESFQFEPSVLRLNTDGSIDAEFGRVGIASIPNGLAGALQPNAFDISPLTGQIAVVGEPTFGQGQMFIAAFIGDEPGAGTTARVTGRFFLDANSDGLETVGELGVPDAMVRLLRGNTEVGTATTDSDGNYTIVLDSPVDSNQYIIEFTKPAAFATFDFTSANDGTDDTIDSDVDTFTATAGTTSAFSLAEGTTVNNIDAGLIVGATPEITLLANGVEFLDGEAAPFTFTDVVIGSDNLPGVQFTIRNDGNAALTLGTPTLPTGFRIDPNDPFPTSVGPGATATFTVQLETFSLGVFQGNISFTHNDIDDNENPFDIPIKGTVNNLILSALFDADLGPFIPTGAVELLNGFVQLSEGSDAAITAQLDLPDNAESLTFDFTWANPGDGDRLVATINGVEVYSVLGTDFSANAPQMTGDIDISDFAGQSVSLDIRVVSTGDVNAVLQVDNVQVLAGDFAEVVAQGKTNAVYTDGDGNTVTVSVKGNGTATVRVPRTGGEAMGDALAIDVTGTDAKSSLSISVKGPTGVTRVGDINIDGPISKIDGKAVDLLGDLATGPVKSVTLHDVKGDHNITIDNTGAGAKDSVAISFNEVEDLVLTSLLPIKSFTAVSWTDTNDATVPDKVQAPSLGKLTIKGDKKSNNAGAFEADIVVTGDPNAKTAFGGASIVGPVDGVNILITGDAGSLAFKDAVSNALVTVSGAFKGLSAGDLSAVTLDLPQGTSKITGKKATNVNMTGGDFGSLAFNTIEGGNFSVDSIKSLTAKADKKTGDVGAINNLIVDLAGSNNPKVKDTLGSLKADGGSTNLDVEMFGSGGSVDLKGAIDQLLYAASGDIKSIKLGDVNNAILDGDSVGAVQAVRWLTGQAIFTDLKSLKTTGDKKTNTPGDLGAAIGINPDGVSTAKVEFGGAKIAGNLTGVWNVFGSTGAIAADAIDAGFDAVIELDVKSLSSKAMFDGFVAARSFGKIDVKTTMTAATIIAFSIPGESSSIGSLKTGGDVTAGTRIYVGVDPVNDTLDDDDDVFKPGADNFIKSLTIGGDAAADTDIVAGAFPNSVSINKAKIDPLADDRFTLTT